MTARPIPRARTRVPERAPTRRSGGFTLVEILVAITLLAIVMLALGAALRGMSQTQSRVAVRLQQFDDFRGATSFLASVAGRVSARKTTGIREVGQSQFTFEGAANGMAWIGIMPPRYGAGGRTFFRLGAEQVNGRQALVIRFVPWQDIPGFPDWSRADSRVLVDDLREFSIAYEDAGTEPPHWLPGWRDTDNLPARIQIHIATATSAWPEWVLPLRQFGGRSGAGMAVIGGSAS